MKTHLPWNRVVSLLLCVGLLITANPMVLAVNEAPGVSTTAPELSENTNTSQSSLLLPDSAATITETDPAPSVDQTTAVVDSSDQSEETVKTGTIATQESTTSASTAKVTYEETVEYSDGGIEGFIYIKVYDNETLEITGNTKIRNYMLSNVPSPSSITNIVIGNDIPGIAYEALGEFNRVESISLPCGPTAYDSRAYFTNIFGYTDLAAGHYSCVRQSGTFQRYDDYWGRWVSFSGYEHTYQPTYAVFNENGTVIRDTASCETISESYSCSHDVLGDLTNTTDIDSEYSRIRVGGIYPSTGYHTRYCRTYHYLIPSSLKSVTITGGSIPSYAFANCTSIEHITIADEVTSIAENAFIDCTSLKTITVDGTIGTIGKNAFKNCTNLTELTINGTVERIDDFAFQSCTSLKTVNIPGVLLSTGQKAFATTPWYQTLTDEFVIVGSNNLLLKYNGTNSTVTIPHTVNRLNDYVFANHQEITQVIFETGELKINANAFSGCSALTTLEIPPSVTYIGANAIPSTCTVYVYENTAGYDYTAPKRVVLTESYTIGDDIFYYIINSRGAVTITGCQTSGTTVTIPASINDLPVDEINKFSFANDSLVNITIPGGVMIIGDFAFFNCPKLTNLTIPPTVKQLGKYVFKNCTGLLNVTLSEGVTSIGNGAFYNCTSLTEALIPDSTTHLGEHAFYGCSALTTVTIGTNTQTIGDHTFYGCHALSTVVVGTSVQSIGDYAFYQCNLTRIALPATVTTIGKYAFYENQPLERVILRAGIITIDAHAFDQCKLLSNISLPEGITTIGDYAFQNCASLTSLTLPSTLTYLGEYAYSGCTGIPSVSIPSSITVVANGTFNQCTALASVVLAGAVTSIGNQAFKGCSFSEITLPNTVTHLGFEAFRGCKNLKSLTMPNAMYVIENSVLADCLSLTDVSMPDSVEKVGTGIFTNNYRVTVEVRFCTGTVAPNLLKDQNVTAVKLDGAITAIGDYAFSACPNLVDITYLDRAPNYNGNCVELSRNVVSIGIGAFAKSTNLKNIYLYDSMQSLGKTAFADIPNVVVVVNYTDDYISSGIAANLFYNQNITKITLNNVTSLGDSAFGNCTALQTVEINNSAKLTACGNNVFANSGNQLTVYCDQVIDNLFNQKATGIVHLYIDGTVGNYAFANTDTLKTITFESATDIGQYAFYSCNKLSTVSIDQVNTIGENAFAESELGTLTIGTAQTIGKNAFLKASVTSAVTIGSVTTIGENAFAQSKIGTLTITAAGTIDKNAFAQSNINTVTIDQVETIGTGAFNGSSIANSVAIGTATNIQDSAFAQTSMLSLSVDQAETIGKQAFYNNAKLATVSVNTVNTVGESAFSDCTALKKATFNNVCTIGNYAFYNCNTLSILTLSRGLVSLGDYAFAECKTLPSLVLPATTNHIGTYAFYNNAALSTINIPAGITTIEESTFYGCVALPQIILPDTVTTIGNSAFYGCVALHSLDLGTGVQTIGENAFFNCNQLAELNLPTTVTTIGDYAFRGCNALKELTIPDSVTDLGNYVFYGCMGLEDVTFGVGTTTIGDQVFYSCANLDSVIFWGDVTYIHDLAFYGAEFATVCAFDNEYIQAYCDTWGLNYVNLSDNFSIVITPPTKTQYTEFDTLDLSGLAVTLNYSIGLQQALTAGYTVSGYDPEVIGTQTITVSYRGKSATFSVNVAAKQVLSLEIVGQIPSQIIVKEELDLSDLSVIVTYADGTKRTLDDQYEMTAFDPETVGTQTITVSYREVSQSYTITVLDYLRGDINGDGIVSIKDLTRLLHALNDNTISVIDAAMDVNGDGHLTQADADHLAAYLQGDAVEIH